MTKVLIVGGGITGLATALVLSRQGIDVDLVERQPQIRAVGSGITMIGAGIRALDRLGLYRECAVSGWAATGVEFYEADGTLAGRQPLPSPLGPGSARSWPPRPRSTPRCARSASAASGDAGT